MISSHKITNESGEYIGSADVYPALINVNGEDRTGHIVQTKYIGYSLQEAMEKGRIWLQEQQ